MEARSWCVWVRVVMKQLETETNPPRSSLPLHPHLLSAKYSIIQPLNSVTGLSNGFGVDPKKLIALDQYYLQTIKNHTHQTLADKGTYTNATNTRNRENKGLKLRKQDQCPQLSLYFVALCLNCCTYLLNRFTCIIISITVLCISFNYSCGT